MAGPVVVLTADSATATWAIWQDRRVALLGWSYVDRIAQAGGVPALAPPIPEAAEELVARADALVLTGGVDIDPARYGATRDSAAGRFDAARDAADFAALAAAQRRGIPVLAICRGMQVLAVARGGTLVQDLPEHGPVSPGRFRQHQIQIGAGSRLAAALGSSVRLHCHHHQGVDRLGTGLVATAWADDGTLEGLEDPAAPFVVGVQAHPEESDTSALFKAFVDAAAQPAGGGSLGKRIGLSR